MIHFPVSGEVTMIDVGQGDSFLIRQPFNRHITLIDTGGKIHFNQQSWQRGCKKYQADRLGINYLKSIGINKIDEICVSHQDADHCGDLTAYLNQLGVGRVIVPLGMNNNPSFIKRLAEANYPLSRLVAVSDHQDNEIFDDLHVLHPFVSGNGENHDSMVILGTFGGQRWLFTGDLDQQGELDVIHRYPSLKADILKVGHHGSKTSSNSEFIRSIQPKVALISAGRQNRYHHPNDETMQILKAERVLILNSQNLGMVRYQYRHNSGKFMHTVNLINSISSK
ncbi:ComEC/Rec2 family competence protein [Lentilactobacillus sp. SPB1-3]|uniref:ComEC/Rec2 family competence protein n=1 Tax=Lentilactobacillus terminaliae TaxID=3003483 RepID=A0ACD5DDT9_9LACO|nr:ComEC/Rec2 family competence protein [Lentilactobacillus sp. SPB1-3]MCZ0977873.1 ComEC/Rec2 family competence protein [Lentilactobacillus sp. SPB1-3]